MNVNDGDTMKNWLICWSRMLRYFEFVTDILAILLGISNSKFFLNLFEVGEHFWLYEKFAIQKTNVETNIF